MNSNDLVTVLPDVAVLCHRCRALAMIEAIVSPEREHRYYSFDAAWAEGEEMASMRNGSGDAYSIVFTPRGAFIRGFDHESPMSPARTGSLWPGLVDTVPTAFLAQVKEPAFSFNGVLEATLCLWRQMQDARWQVGAIDYPEFGGYRSSPDGAEMLTILCDGGPETYLAFAADYYGLAVDPGAAAHVWALHPLNDEIVGRLNSDLTLADVQQDIQAIGYPAA